MAAHRPGRAPSRRPPPRRRDGPSGGDGGGTAAGGAAAAPRGAGAGARAAAPPAPHPGGRAGGRPRGDHAPRAAGRRDGGPPCIHTRRTTSRRRGAGAPPRSGRGGRARRAGPAETDPTPVFQCPPGVAPSSSRVATWRSEPDEFLNDNPVAPYPGHRRRRPGAAAARRRPGLRRRRPRRPCALVHDRVRNDGGAVGASAGRRGGCQRSHPPRPRRSHFSRSPRGRLARQAQARQREGAARAYARVERWTRGVDVFAKKFLLVPVVEDLHWSLAIVCHPGELAKRAVARERRELDVGATEDEDEDEDCPLRPCVIHMDSNRQHSAKKIEKWLRCFLEMEWRKRHSDEELHAPERDGEGGRPAGGPAAGDAQGPAADEFVRLRRLHAALRPGVPRAPVSAPGSPSTGGTSPCASATTTSRRGSPAATSRRCAGTSRSWPRTRAVEDPGRLPAGAGRGRRSTARRRRPTLGAPRCCTSKTERFMSYPSPGRWISKIHKNPTPFLYQLISKDMSRGLACRTRFEC